MATSSLPARRCFIPVARIARDIVKRAQETGLT
jgi:hypothetical protein